MRVLLTGFGPFGNVIDNPTARMAAHFGRDGLPGHYLTARVLPVSYRRASEEVRELLREGSFDLALLLGVAAGSESIRLEIFGRNRGSTRKEDADQEVSSGLVREGGPSVLRTGISVAGLVGILRDEGIAARVSRSAGDYVCNHAYYSALDTIRSEGLRTRCLFVHVPADEVTSEGMPLGPVMPYELQVCGVEIILRRVVSVVSM